MFCRVVVDQGCRPGSEGRFVFCCLRSEKCLGMMRKGLRRAMGCCWSLGLILIVLTLFKE
jgi:hypothetical protein